jgi:YVTN family beta-propeller protein
MLRPRPTSRSLPRRALWLLPPLAAMAVGGTIAAARELGSSDRPRSNAVPSEASTHAHPRPPAPRRHGVYAAATATHLRGPPAGVPERLYVPNSDADTLDVIDARRLRVIAHFKVGAVPHHVTPSWGLRRLYVDDTRGNSLTVIDPRKGRPVRTIPVPDPYNLYFSPDGSKAIVVAERSSSLDFRSPRTWRLVKRVPIPWPGVDHLDFSADGRYLLASAEFSGMVARVSLRSMKVTGSASVGGQPVDVKLSPDGRVFYVANQGRGGVSVIDPRRMKEVRFLRTGAGAHGLAVSRDARSLYVSNRLAGSISVIDARSRRVRATWRIGGSPDMLQVSTSGRRLWATGRYNASVYVISTRTGRVIKTIAVGAGAHGLAYFPQPGRFSVGHNGVYR